MFPLITHPGLDSKHPVGQPVTVSVAVGGMAVLVGWGVLVGVLVRVGVFVFVDILVAEASKVKVELTKTVGVWVAERVISCVC